MNESILYCTCCLLLWWQTANQIVSIIQHHTIRFVDSPIPPRNILDFHVYCSVCISVINWYCTCCCVTNSQPNCFEHTLPIVIVPNVSWLPYGPDLAINCVVGIIFLPLQPKFSFLGQLAMLWIPLNWWPSIWSIVESGAKNGKTLQ